ncbi:hypothetical protein [Labrenzia sp. PHM005]|uniref:hypothetical protein n=1 Tax=Labrenzia sp. PHM005 TaxID=2590016 RepID=UPI0011400498|nr:hypothetical protein [Labrenzia sp. PHM005]QDG75539.1 hypothetical protein FJ695_06485 [Labrenzia sp. PHM005]
MATTIERPVPAQVVAHATEYPADRDGDGTGYGRRQKSTAERQDQDTGSPDEAPAVLIDDHHIESHVLDGMAAYQAAALEVLEPGIDHGPVHPLPGPVDRVPPQNVRHAYQDHPEADDPPHKVNVAT